MASGTKSVRERRSGSVGLRHQHPRRLAITFHEPVDQCAGKLSLGNQIDRPADQFLDPAGGGGSHCGELGGRVCEHSRHRALCAGRGRDDQPIGRRRPCGAETIQIAVDDLDQRNVHDARAGLIEEPTEFSAPLAGHHDGAPQQRQCHPRRSRRSVAAALAVARSR